MRSDTGRLRRLIATLALLALGGCNLPATSRPTPTPIPPQPTARTALLTAAWVDAGNLLVWRTGDDLPRRIAASGVIQPWISPDGTQVAFTRGPQGQPDSLWIADVQGVAERQLAGPQTFSAPEGLRRAIGQVAWVETDTLRFNTVLLPTEPGPGGGKADDLWHADTRATTITRLLADGAGGDFALSPDGTRLALVQPGFYGQTQGRIWLAALDGSPLSDLLTFDAPATASEYSFYPALQWLADSSALLTALPEPDHIYPPAEDAPPRLATLWRLPVEGDAVRLSALPASFFGLPRWSPDGAWLTYLEAVGPREANQLQLMLAAGDGSGATPLLEGPIGALEAPVWIAAGYTYTAPEPGNLWLGVPGQPPSRLPSAQELAFYPRWADSSLLVYASAAVSPAELRAYDLATGLLTVIGEIAASTPVFDALRLP